MGKGTDMCRSTTGSANSTYFPASLSGPASPSSSHKDTISCHQPLPDGFSRARSFDWEVSTFDSLGLDERPSSHTSSNPGVRTCTITLYIYFQTFPMQKETRLGPQRRKWFLRQPCPRASLARHPACFTALVHRANWMLPHLLLDLQAAFPTQKN